ncbi:MAG: cysteine hydrolase [Cellulosilyticum sp.]|nr:cysteine hydrolase [Cellulosilyticum sp.]
MVLLVVDTQKLITNEKLYSFDYFVSHVQELIDTARGNGIEVIYVRHDDGEGHELTKGKPGYEIYEPFKPQESERIFDKEVNSAFKGTGLLEYLRRIDENEIMVVGLQTDYCMDATIKCGFEHGFQMIVPAHTNTTVDNNFMTGEQSYIYYNEHMWPRRYAQCITFEEAMSKIRGHVLK